MVRLLDSTFSGYRQLEGQLDKMKYCLSLVFSVSIRMMPAIIGLAVSFLYPVCAQNAESGAAPVTRPNTPAGIESAKKHKPDGLLPKYQVLNTQILKKESPPFVAYDWHKQTQGALSLAQSIAEHDAKALLTLALEAFASEFRGWFSVIVPNQPAKQAVNAKRHDVFVPNPLELFSGEDYVEELRYNKYPIQRTVAIQLPMVTTLFVLEKDIARLRPTEASTLLDPVLLSKAETCKKDPTLVYSFWTSDKHNSPSSYRLIAINAKGCVIDWEGGVPSPVSATQLLIYNGMGRLLLIAGFGQITLFDW
jgi:hypothetical protein